jgi:hypothetical protein
MRFLRFFNELLLGFTAGLSCLLPTARRTGIALQMVKQKLKKRTMDGTPNFNRCVCVTIHCFVLLIAIPVYLPVFR